MNILLVCDVPDWAIGRLTKSIVKYNERHKFFIVYVHPKQVGNSVSEVYKVIKENHIDLWHAMYWNSGVRLLEVMPQLKEIPSVISHHNHKSLNDFDWKSAFNSVVIPTRWGYEKLKEMHQNVHFVPYGLDLDEFSYIEDREDDHKTIGYIGRVVPHKNLAKICEAATQTGYKVLGSGYIDKPDYWETVDKTNLEFIGGIGRNHKNTWEEKNEIYKRMTCFVAYSSDEVETGTLPLLEAMARGIPVLSTAQGMARDLIEDFKNGLIFDETNFVDKLQILMGDRELQDELRRNARKTMSQYSEEKMAIGYGKVYTSTFRPNHKLVSVIVPTYNRQDTLQSVIMSIDKQTHDNIEIIIVDDGSTDSTEETISSLSPTLKCALKYVKQPKNGYGLASARNRGVVEARGEILVFLDDRMCLEPTAVEEFIKNTNIGEWNYGKKISNNSASIKRSFVENFSCIYKKDLVRIGMFNERLEWYGGLSQDCRTKCAMNSIKNRYIDSAVAHVIRKSAKFKYPEQIWKSKLLLHKLYD